jgi:hypothetical protein
MGLNIHPRGSTVLRVSSVNFSFFLSGNGCKLDFPTSNECARRAAFNIKAAFGRRGTETPLHNPGLQAFGDRLF